MPKILKVVKMDNKDFGNQMEKRTKQFALSIIKMSVSLPSIQESKVIKNQIAKSGTSVGANYREANRSRSKADFKNKIKICESEASETVYWLELIKEMNWLDESKIQSILKEANELVALFTSISSKLKL